MRLEKVTLFCSKKEFALFLGMCVLLALTSLSYHYYHYTQLTKFDSQLVDATVLSLYPKTKTTKKGKIQHYQLLKLRSDDGTIFYTLNYKPYKNLLNKTLQLEVWTGKISFLAYLKGYFAFSKILHIYPQNSLYDKLHDAIIKQHASPIMQSLFSALFLAQPLNTQLQNTLSALGVSHLLAISGFHLGLLSFLLLALFKHPYRYLQQHFFPYRSFEHDAFVFIALSLLIYMVFIHTPPSLLRAYGMFVIAYILYAKGFEIISLQTLFLTVILLLAAFPKLLFSLGFFLSVAGVYAIFLLLHHYKNKTKWWYFVVVPFWVYLVMLPFSIAIFGNFSLYHPLSILWTTLFIAFYPLEMFLHLIHQGSLLDGLLHMLLNTQHLSQHQTLSKSFFTLYLVIFFLAYWSKKLFSLLLFMSTFLFIYFIYQIT